MWNKKFEKVLSRESMRKRYVRYVRSGTPLAFVTTFGLLMLVLSGCGGTSNSNGLQGLPGNTWVTTNTGTGTSTIVDPSPLNTPYTKSFSITGATGSNPSYTSDELQTDSILKVRIAAGNAGPLQVPYQSYNLSFGCVRYQINLYAKVNGNWVKNGATLTSDVLAAQGGNNWNCQGKPGEQVWDLSSRVSGSAKVKVEVTGAANDFYCNYWWWIYNMGYDPYYYVGTYAMNCPVKPNYKTHSATGTLVIGTNGTTF